MAEGNAEIVRRATELFNRGDLDGALEPTDEDFEWDWSNSIGPLKGVYRGREAVEGLWNSFTEAWEEVTWEPQEFIELDDGGVIVVNQVHMRGRGSGVDVDATGAQLWTFKEGRVTRVKLFQTKEEALEATTGA